MIIRHFLPLLVLIVCANPSSYAQNEKATERLWENLPEQAIQARQQSQRPDQFRALRINSAKMQRTLKRIPHERNKTIHQGEIMEFPMPDGRLEHFSIHETQVMALGLAAKFPEIKTYVGRGIEDPTATLRMDRTPQGFHAQILSSRGAVYIDPLTPRDTETVISYYKRDYRKSADDFHCYVDTSDDFFAASRSSQTGARSGSELRTYKLACATTGEYTQYHGGTVLLGQAAVVTAINRVTGIYEVELSIRLELVANNDQLIYTNSGSDPYSNNNPSALLSQNQTNIDTVIGNSNYDIGHVFSTGGGGLAGLGVVGINSVKAQGETGLANPTGDAFYVDFVAHEIGHQFGGNHTFNGDSGNCAGGNRNGSTAYEPGSGSTIQAYAGICGDDNLQSNSDPYFHSVSFDEMLSHVDGVIPTVGIRTATGNSVPSATAGNDYTIPAQTPFELTASGTDPDGNGSLTYNWEERDIGPQQDVNAGDNGSSPLFRSWPATTASSRTFPRLTNLLNNTTVIGETLPTTTRTMNFRVTVRDNELGGGGVDTDDMTVSVVNTGAAFRVTAPNTAVNWSALSNQTITWDVAGTTANGINATNVTILLSTDGGSTYPTTILASTPNDGSQVVSTPNIQTSQARIRVQGENNIFFDISNSNFTISEPLLGFTLSSASSTELICAPNDAVYSIDTQSISGFTDPVTLSISGIPANTTATFSTNPVTPGASSTLTISNTGDAAAGSYLLQVSGSSGLLNDSLPLALELSTSLPGNVSLTAPAQGAVGVSLAPTFTWVGASQATSYRLEIDNDPTFSSPSHSIETSNTTATPSTDLNLDTPYYCRVVAINNCGSTISDYFYFTTNADPGTLCNSPAIAIPDDNASGISDSIITAASGTLNDLDVSVNIPHSWIGDLTVELKHIDTGTSVMLVAKPGIVGSGNGSSEDNINVVLDDEAALTVEDSAPYVPGNSYSPNGSLSDFDGESLTGTWTLTVKDTTGADVGTLQDWCLIPTVAFSSTAYPLLTISDLTTAGDQANAVIPVTLNASFGSAVTVAYVAISGSATVGDDFIATSDTLSISTGGLADNISIPLISNTEFESDETFSLILSAPINVIIPDNQITITLTDTSTPLVNWLNNFELDLSNLNDDADADGLTTFLEYGFNLDPTKNALTYYDPSVSVGAGGPVGIPRIELDESGLSPRLQIVFPRRKVSSGSGLTYTGSFSSDLISWLGQTPDSVTSIDATWEKVTITDPLTTDTAPDGKRFGKVDVTHE